jgi:parallel beta-helix repeat protein
LAQPQADYFVAPNGNDAWTGTLAAPNTTRTDGPFASPARALQAARQLRKTSPPNQPIVVLLRGGRYELPEPLTFTALDSGTKTSPLLVAAYPEETPVLSGGTRVQPQVEQGLWVIPVPGAKAPLRHISVGGALRLPARWPKQGQFTISGLAGADPKANYRTPADRFEFAPGQIDPTWPNLTDVEVVVLHFWVDGHYRIKSVDAQTRVVTLDRPSLRRFTEDHGPGPARFYLLNVPAALAPGEFYHDRAAGVLRYRPTDGETPDKTPLVVPQLDTVVRFDGRPEKGQFVEHVELRGLTLSDSTWDIGPKAAGDLQAAQHVPGAVRLRGAKHCALRDSRLVNLGGYGIELADGCRGNQVRGNELAHLAAGGIRQSGGAAGSPLPLRTGDNVIADNHLHHLGQRFHAGVGILSQHADHTRIEHNHIHHLDYTGISVGWVWGYGASVSVGNVVAGNLIHDIGQRVLSDMGGVYLLGVSPGTVVRGNVVRDVEAFGYGGWGIYTDEGSSGITIENNLVYRTKSGGFHQHFGKDNVVRNNIFALAREGQIMRSKAEAHLSFTFERNIVYFKDAPLFARSWKDDNFVVDHNLYWDAAGKEVQFPGGRLKDWQARGHDTHSLVADPLFTDPDQGDFRLQPGSPAAKIGFQPFDYATAGVRPKDKK